MRRMYCLMSAALIFALVPLVTSAEVKTAATAAAEQAAPTIEKAAAPPAQAPAEITAESAAAQPVSLVYVGSEGSFLLQPGRSRGVFRWSGTHWANSISFVFEDANYWVYQLDGSNGWFAFGKNPSGTTYSVFKGLGAASNSITWQDLPSGWMQATRNTATGNMN